MKKTSKNETLKFIDLFSGIGGFHQAMISIANDKGIKAECVFSSEIDKYAIETYEKNYHISSDNNVRDADITIDIPNHQILCAGFPCQTFSKAGKREGFNDETKGTLFFEIERILKKHHTKYIVLENVRNLASHDKGRTWKVIRSHLRSIGYRLTKEPLILSPHQIGIPQLRERVIILGVYDPENVDIDLEFDFSDFINPQLAKDKCNISTILEEELVDDKYKISKYEEMVLNAWNEFYQGIDIKIIGYPVNADYFNIKLSEEDMDLLPQWKKNFIRKNKELYQRNKKFIDKWLKKYNNLEDFVPTHRKFEWQAGDSIQNIWEGLIQLRPSGIRVKKPTCFPALVAMVQIPIIGSRKRRLTLKECARLQSFPENFIPCDNSQQAYKQFGNAVNVEVIKRATLKLLEKY